MPDETEQKETIEQPEEETSEGAAEEAPKSRSLLKLMLLVLPAILVPATAGAFVAYTQFPGLARTAAAVGIDFGLVDEPEEEEPVQYGEFHVLSDIIVNPAGSSGKRFLLVSIGLESLNPEVLAEVGAKDIVVRDIILRVLSERSTEELASIEYRDEIKQELRTALNELLEAGEIDRLYFTQFVLQ